ncbi:MAG: poly-gamma-glutamate biosynthesis protein PgsC/CapC [Stackebrandtia sp.]
MSGAMSTELAAMGLAIGLVLALVCYLFTNLSPGGMITPGWLALTFMADYGQALLAIGLTVVTFGVTKLLQRNVILYGKRLFAAVLLVGVILQSTVFLIIQYNFPLLFEHHILGFVVPGLIAYQLARQRVVTTIVATGTVTLASYLILLGAVFVSATWAV